MHTQVVAKTTIVVVKYMLLVVTWFHRFFGGFPNYTPLPETRPGGYEEMVDH